MKINKSIAIAVVAMGALFVNAADNENAVLEEESNLPSLEIGLDVTSKQVTYGIVDNVDPIFTLSAVSEWNGFTVEVAGIFDTTDQGVENGYGDREFKYQELDVAIGYTHLFVKDDYSFLPTDIELSGNWTYVYHPAVDSEYYDESGKDPNPNTQVLNFSIALPEIFLSPTLSWEIDVDDEHGAQYFLFELGHEFILSGTEDESVLSLGLGAGLGVGNAKRNMFDCEKNKSSFKDVSLTASLNWTPCETITISPYITITEQLTSELRDVADESNEGHGSCFVYGGVSISASF